MSSPKIKCFIIMPISDHNDYEKGHFSRVYKHLIKPACESIGLETIRADEVKNTNYIVLDILQRTIQSDIAICDLSSRNPNVLYELGIRQAFNMPVVLIKDTATPRIFDIQGFRTYDYDETLRIDNVEKDRTGISKALQSTMAKEGADINSLVQLLGLKAAKINKSTKITAESKLILDELKHLSNRLISLENNTKHVQPKSISFDDYFTLPNGHQIKKGDELFSGIGGNKIGLFAGNSESGIVVEDHTGYLFVIPPDDDRYQKVVNFPF